MFANLLIYPSLWLLLLSVIHWRFEDWFGIYSLTWLRHLSTLSLSVRNSSVYNVRGLANLLSTSPSTIEQFNLNQYCIQVSWRMIANQVVPLDTINMFYDSNVRLSHHHVTQVFARYLRIQEHRLPWLRDTVVNSIHTEKRSDKKPRIYDLRNKITLRLGPC